MEEISAQEDSYVQQHIDQYGHKFELPNSIFIGAKLHPIKKDHVVVLSRNVFPQGKKIYYLYNRYEDDSESDHAEISQIDIMNHPYFQKALLECERSEKLYKFQETKEDDKQNTLVPSKMNSEVFYSSEENKYQKKEEEKVETVPHSSLNTPESKNR